jgi:hypothetical protein
MGRGSEEWLEGLRDDFLERMGKIFGKMVRICEGSMWKFIVRRLMIDAWLFPRQWLCQARRPLALKSCPQIRVYLVLLEGASSVNV